MCRGVGRPARDSSSYLWRNLIIFSTREHPVPTKVERLKIIGHGDEPLTNTFFRQDAGSGHLAIVFPGLGYRCSGPLLWYPSRILLAHGADVLWAEYAYDLRGDWMASDERGQKAWLFEDATAACRSAMKHGYERVTVVGKSLGTLAMGRLFSTEGFPDKTGAVWLTPVLSDPDLRNHLEATHVPSLLLIGTNDPYYDEGFIRRLRKNPAFEIEIVDGADHSLETRDGVLPSIDILKGAMKTVQGFIAR